MKIKFIFCLSLLFLFACNDSDSNEIETDEDKIEILTFSNFNQKISYCIGIDYGYYKKQMYQSPQFRDKFNTNEIKKGLIDYLSGNELRIKTYQVDGIFEKYLREDGNVDSSQVSCADGSYAFGMNEAAVLVASFVSKGIDQTLVVDLLVKGIDDGFTGKKTSVSVHEASQEVSKYYNEINKEMGEKFLANNAKKDGVITTESGLQYQIFKETKGYKPNLRDTVIVHYTGRFIDGTEFESTVPSNVPAKFEPFGTIAGWQEGIQLMSIGAQYRFFIPQELGYGIKGNVKVPAYSALVFDIELLDVVKYVKK